MPYLAAEDGGEKKKKSRQAHRGSRQGTGCPNEHDTREDTSDDIDESPVFWASHLM